MGVLNHGNLRYPLGGTQEIIVLPEIQSDHQQPFRFWENIMRLFDNLELILVTNKVFNLLNSYIISLIYRSHANYF